MKEVTTIVTLEITSVVEYPDDKTEKVIEIDRLDAFKQHLGESIKHELNVDDVVVTNIQDFVMDVK